MLLFLPGSLNFTNKKHFSRRDNAERYPRQNEQLKCNAVSTKSHVDREIDMIHMLMNGSTEALIYGFSGQIMESKVLWIPWTPLREQGRSGAHS